jgi:hypothetical protein
VFVAVVVIVNRDSSERPSGTYSYCDPDAVDTSLPAAGFEYTFREKADRCEAGYVTINLEGVDRDVTHCFSGSIWAGAPRTRAVGPPTRERT